MTDLAEGHYLYHYTTMRGLLGIAESKTLWATNIRYLNDATEFLHALHMVRMQRDLLALDLEKDERLLLQKLLADDLPDDDFSKMASFGLSYYVVSLTTEWDSLSQWREYARRSGYALGIPFDTLRQFAPTARFQLRECNYDLEMQATSARQVVMDAIRRFRQTPFQIDSQSKYLSTANSAELKLAKEIQEQFHLQLSLFATTAKNPVFAAEREWRLVSDAWVQDFGAPKFREGRTVLVPYLEVPLVPMLNGGTQVQVICGPSPELALSQNSAMNVLVGQNWPNFVVGRSLVPYRDW
jgi:hypothetical protein